MLLDHLGELGVLRQEAVAGMDRVGAGDGRGGQDRRDVEIAVARRRRADADALVGQAHMHGVGVGGRMHGHGLDAHLAAGAVDAQRDLAAVGDQDLVEHAMVPTRRSSAARRTRPAGRSRPGSGVTVPALGALIGFIIFIASMISSVWPCCHLVADRDEGRLPGSAREIGGADHRRLDGAGMLAEIAVGGRRRASGGRSGGGRGRRGAGARPPVTAGRATRMRLSPSASSISARPVSSRSCASLRTNSVSMLEFCHGRTLRGFGQRASRRDNACNARR